MDFNKIQRRKLLENCGGILCFVVYAGYTQHHDMGVSKSHGNCCSFIALIGISWERPWESTKVVYDCNFSRETSFCGETWIFKNQDHQQMIFHYSDPSLLRWPWFFNDNLVYLWVHEDYPYLWFSWHSRLVLLRKSWEFHSSSWFLGCFVQNFPKKLWWPCHPWHATKKAWNWSSPVDGGPGVGA